MITFFIIVLFIVIILLILKINNLLNMIKYLSHELYINQYKVNKLILKDLDDQNLYYKVTTDINGHFFFINRKLPLEQEFDIEIWRQQLDQEGIRLGLLSPNNN
jgi:predicted Holliday junction resolvase-like endonuclease